MHDTRNRYENERGAIDPMTLRTAAAVVAVAALSICLCSGTQARADDSTEIHGFVENATHAREDQGVVKLRNTAQLEGVRRFGRVGIFRDVSFAGIFRATYDGVYDAHSNRWGSGAGEAIMLESGGGFVPHADTSAFGNTGLRVLGDPLHAQNGGVAMGVPVRPCDIDPRGCITGYGDKTRNELRFPEFNERFDAIREAYFNATIPGKGDDELLIRLGRQQVVWGRTDLFRVLDVVNPVDYSRHNIYDELEDIRIPMWILNADYRMGPTSIFQDLNFSLMWNFDKFRPNDLGQGGQPYAILDTGNFFRGMNNCWHNGCTIANLAPIDPTDPNTAYAAVNFGPNQIGIRRANLPNWSLANTQIGGKVEGVYKGVGFSLNALYYRSQFPSLRGGIPADNPFTPTVESQAFGHLIAFDIDFPRIFLIGGSADFYVDSIESVFRVEVANSHGEEFANTIRERLFSESDVIRWVVGWDRPTFIRPLNRRRAFLFSAQLFGQHILDHEIERVTDGFGVSRKRGMPDWENNVTGTLLIQGGYFADRVTPQLILAHDYRAKATVWAPSVDWLVTDNWRVRLVANFKTGHGARRFDDCRSCDPFDIAPPVGVTDSIGLASQEPLGKFRSGPIGMAQKEDEIQLTVRYRF